MERSPLRLTVAAALALIACIAVNIWLFRVGILWGILGLNVSKHIAIAYLCQVLGVDRRHAEPVNETHQSTQSPSQLPLR